MAIEKTIKINVDATGAEQNIDELGNSFQELNQETEQSNKSLRQLQKRLKEMAIAGETNTQEFKDLSLEVANMQKAVRKANKQVGKLSKSFKQNLEGSVTGVIHAFELGQGIMGAFGVESENVEKALLKVQSAMAIAQGFEGVAKSVSSFKGLATALMSTAAAQNVLTGATKLYNLVLKANPIGLIITGVVALTGAITALIVNFKSITNWLGITNDEAEQLHQENLKRTEAFIEMQGKRIEALSKEREQIQKTRDFEIKMMKARGDSEEEIFKAIRKNRKERIISNNEFIQQIKAQTLAIASQLQLQFKSGELTEEKQKELMEEITKNEELAAKLAKESQELSEQILIDDANAEREAQEKKEKLNKEYSDKRKERDREEFEARMAEYLRLKKVDEDLEQWQKERLEREEAQRIKESELNKQAINEIEAFLDAELAKEEAIVNAQIEADKIKEELAKAELEREIALKDAKLSLASETFGALGNLVQTFAGENEEQQRRAFNIQKAISIAQAVIDTYKGANAIFASAAANPGTVLFPAQPFIAAGAAIASGLANVATIARQEFNPSGGGASAGAGGGGGGASNPPAALSTPAVFNVVGNTGTNQLAETLGQQPLQAYVVAGDVTTAQSLERNKIQQSTL
jgi:hypothetical protein